MLVSRDCFDRLTPWERATIHLWTGEIEEELLGRSGFAGRGTAGFTVTPPGIVAVTGLLANSISLWSAPNPGGVVGFE